MNRESTVWLLLMLMGAAGLIYKATMTETGLGTVYVKPARVDADQQPLAWTESPAAESGSQFSLYRTAGLWMAAFLTLSIFSYLYQDNLCYKLAESIIVGVSAGYFLVISFWDSVVAQLLVELTPRLMHDWALPGTDPDKPVDLWFLVPLVLSAFLFCRFFPPVSFLAKWPLAFVVGTFAGLRLVLFLEADFISQIRNSIVPLIVFLDGSFSFWSTVRNITFLVSLLACLTYFFFSVPHQGTVGGIARVGVWVLMITFGASFAFTVMGRITLLTMRFEFLFIDWLRLIPG